MRLAVLAFLSLLATTAAADGNDDHFGPMDVFGLEWVTDPQISPDGSRIVYVRNFMDVMTDARRSNLWILDAEGADHRPVASGPESQSSPRWSPDGKRLAYVSSADGSSQIFVRWMDSETTARVTNLTSAPSGLTWSPDGRLLAFSMHVPSKPVPFVEMPQRPEGAEWAPPPKVITKLQYRFDGQGYLKDGYYHLFVVPSEGGTPRQLTEGEFHHRDAPSWSPDGQSLVFSANRHANWEYEPLDSEVYEVSLGDSGIKELTQRRGPDASPVVSPDGERIAYLGFDDRYQGYQVTKLYVMGRDGSNPTELTGSLDRNASSPKWNGNGDGLYFDYDDAGETKVAFVPLDGPVQTLSKRVGGISLSRPYSGGSFSVSKSGRFAFTYSDASRPADLAVSSPQVEPKLLTRLNEDLLGHKTLGDVEEIWVESSHDGRRIHGWVVKPPDFDATKKYPLILEIHGGPFAAYGPHFSAEVQLYAAAGYVVLYANPRGSSSYGGEFGNAIHHAYPSHDYDDLMSGVDAVLQKGYIDESRLYVTGGSGGGVLTSWIVGHTDRFRAAVAAKPVINWYSFVLTADAYPFFTRYWFPGFPWDHTEHYMRRSPLAYVGNVTTPTMLLTGEEDYRTPISESEQFYQALKLRRVDTALVRIPEASHEIASRPSQLIAKVQHILKWFEMHGGAAESGDKTETQ
ncbi:MAG TPA: S9 family peptidase [Vicinamibacteria bacterium]|nr:S9 family peptidase [Vicinamibacteria bacterium]